MVVQLQQRLSKVDLPLTLLLRSLIRRSQLLSPPSPLSAFDISPPFNALPATPTLPAEMTPFKCFICPDSYYRQGEWASHEKLAHSFKCDSCDEIKITEGDLTKHMINYHGIKPIIQTMQFNCDQCPFTATLNRALKTHMKKHHPPTYICEMCEFTAFDPTIMNHHVHSTHMTQKPKLNLTRLQEFRCHDCTFTSTHETTLEDHVNDKHALPTELLSKGQKRKSHCIVQMRIVNHITSLSFHFLFYYFNFFHVVQVLIVSTTL